MGRREGGGKEEGRREGGRGEGGRKRGEYVGEGQTYTHRNIFLKKL